MNGTRNMTRTLASVCAAALVATLAGCDTRDRAGGDAGADVTVLTFAQPNDGEPPDQLLAWAEEVQAASDGSLEIDFQNGWRLGEPTYESDTIADIRDGEVDMGWVGARALDRADITSFQALLAPMLIDSQALQSRVFEDGIPEEMLADLAGDGLVGVGVLPGPLRKLLGLHHPFVRPADFDGATVGMQDSAVAEATFEALGASAEALPSGTQELGGVDAYEQQLQSIWGNQYQAQAGYLTADLNLWPRPLVLLVDEEVYDGLSDDQQQALTDAGEAAVFPALDASAAEDVENIDDLCQSGLEIANLSPTQRAALQEAVQPVHDQLRQDPETAAWLDRIAQLKAEVGVGADGMDCSEDTGAPVAGALPSGTYRSTLTVDDVARGCPEGALGAEPLRDREQVDRTLELVVEGDRLLQTEYPVGHPELREPGWSGTYRTFRDTFELTEDGPFEPLSMTWDFDGSRLVLSDMRTDFCDAKTVWTSNPWVLVDGPQGDDVEGDYVMRVNWQETEPAGCPPGGEEGTADEVIYDLSLHDGEVEMWVRIGGEDATREPGLFGSYSVFRDRIQVSDSTFTLTATYVADDEAITFSDLEGGECGDRTIMTSLPWRRR